jgi:protein-S-isoprenylcysteine O-methyltransferase Ste14
MSFIPGYESLVAKLPELSSVRGILRALATLIVVFGVALAALRFLDTPGTRFLALILQLVIYTVTYFLLKSFFHGPAERMPYATAFFNRFLPAVGLNLASLAYILFNHGTVVIEGRPPIGLFTLRPVQWFFWLVALYLALTAVVLAVRAVQAAGVDTLSGAYIYYGDEGRAIESDIYSLMRHPAYAALDRLALAFALWNGSPYALLLALLFVAVWHPIWYGMEERELLARFGDSYRSYRETVPAVVPRGLPGGEINLIELLTRRSLI